MDAVNHHPTNKSNAFPPSNVITSNVVTETNNKSKSNTKVPTVNNSQ
jgi:hypothetical protein